MRCIHPLATAAMLAGLLAGAALAADPAQTLVTPNGVIVPKLPAPVLAEDAPPAAFLAAARNAIAANRLPEAQEALERAESRALDRSVRPSAARQPSGQPLVRQIAAARQALSGGDRARAVQLIDSALRAPAAGGAEK